MMNQAYQNYKNQAVMTMTQGQMLLTVYDELIKQLSLALRAFEKKDIPEINRSLQKSQKAIKLLQGTLDFKYSVSNNLNDLYNYFNRVIINANIKKDPSQLNDILQMISELRKTFSEAEKISKK